MPNELNTLAKYIEHQIVSDTYWQANFPTAKFFEESKPTGIKVNIPCAMFVLVHADDETGAFGFRLYVEGIYEIKAFMAGTDYSKVADMSNQLDRIFDWTNQIDIAAGRPKSQDVYVDPDDGTSITVMTMVRRRAIKYPTYIENLDHVNLGGEYYIQHRIT